MRCGLSSVVQLRLGELTEADAGLERDLAITEAAYGPDQPDISSTLIDLGIVDQPKRRSRRKGR
jgi:hypothetical protein